MIRFIGRQRGINYILEGFKNNQEEIIDIKGPEHLFFFEAELASQSIAKEKLQAPHPAMSWEDTLGNLKALDQWRNKVNYKLPQDEI